MSSKKQINKQEAAKLWLSSLLTKSHMLEEFVDRINKSLDTQKIIIEDIKISSFRFLVAMAVLDCYKLQILYPKYSVNIFSKLEKLLRNEFQFDDNAFEVVLQIFDLYFDMLRFSQLQHEQHSQYSPYEKLSEELVKAWVGKNLKKYYVPKTRTISPIVCSILSAHLEIYTKFWNLFSEKYEIIEVEK